jgi:hypothetical protein
MLELPKRKFATYVSLVPTDHFTEIQSNPNASGAPYVF